MEKATAWVSWTIASFLRWIQHMVLLMINAICFMLFGTDRRIGPCGSTIERLGQKSGIIVETHTVHTTDEYELVLHRLRKRDNSKLPSRGPILLMHGLLECSVVWMASGEDSIAFDLLNLGFDVWLGNNRGNSYSSPKWGLWGSKAQDYDFTDIAKHDFPAKVAYVLECSKASQLRYIGQSQGAAQAVVGISEHPHLADKIRSLTMVAPALALRAPKNKAVAFVMNKFPGIGYRILFQLISIAQCITPGVILGIWASNSTRLMGWMKNRMDLATSKVMFASTPSCGTSVANMMYWVNLGVQGSQHSYDPNKISCPVYCYFGGEDEVVCADKTAKLVNEFPDVRGVHRVDEFAHLDFLYSKSARSTVHSKMIEELCRP